MTDSPFRAEYANNPISPLGIMRYLIPGTTPTFLNANVARLYSDLLSPVVFQLQNNSNIYIRAYGSTESDSGGLNPETLVMANGSRYTKLFGVGSIDPSNIASGGANNEDILIYRGNSWRTTHLPLQTLLDLDNFLSNPGLNGQLIQINSNPGSRRFDPFRLPYMQTLFSGVRRQITLTPGPNHHITGFRTSLITNFLDYVRDNEVIILSGTSAGTGNFLSMDSRGANIGDTIRIIKPQNEDIYLWAWDLVTNQGRVFTTNNSDAIGFELAFSGVVWYVTRTILPETITARTDDNIRALFSATQNLSYDSDTGRFTGPDLSGYATTIQLATKQDALPSSGVGPVKANNGTYSIGNITTDDLANNSVNADKVNIDIDALNDVATKPTTGNPKIPELNPSTGNITWVDKPTAGITNVASISDIGDVPAKPTTGNTKTLDLDPATGDLIWEDKGSGEPAESRDGVSASKELFYGNVDITTANTIQDIPGLIITDDDAGNDISFLFEIDSPTVAFFEPFEITGKILKEAPTISNTASGNQNLNGAIHVFSVKNASGTDVSENIDFALFRRENGQIALQSALAGEDPMPLRVTQRMFGEIVNTEFETREVDVAYDFTTMREVTTVTTITSQTGELSRELPMAQSGLPQEQSTISQTGTSDNTLSNTATGLSASPVAYRYDENQVDGGITINGGTYSRDDDSNLRSLIAEPTDSGSLIGFYKSFIASSFNRRRLESGFTLKGQVWNIGGNNHTFQDAVFSSSDVTYLFQSIGNIIWINTDGTLLRNQPSGVYILFRYIDNIIRVEGYGSGDGSLALSNNPIIQYTSTSVTFTTSATFPNITLSSSDITTLKNANKPNNYAFKYYGTDGNEINSRPTNVSYLAVAYSNTNQLFVYVVLYKIQGTIGFDNPENGNSNLNTIFEIFFITPQTYKYSNEQIEGGFTINGGTYSRIDEVTGPLRITATQASSPFTSRKVFSVNQSELSNGFTLKGQTWSIHGIDYVFPDVLFTSSEVTNIFNAEFNGFWIETNGTKTPRSALRPDGAVLSFANTNNTLIIDPLFNGRSNSNDINTNPVIETTQDIIRNETTSATFPNIALSSSDITDLKSGSEAYKLRYYNTSGTRVNTRPTNASYLGVAYRRSTNEVYLFVALYRMATTDFESPLSISGLSPITVSQQQTTTNTITEDVDFSQFQNINEDIEETGNKAYIFQLRDNGETLHQEIIFSDQLRTNRVDGLPFSIIRTRRIQGADRFFKHTWTIRANTNNSIEMKLSDWTQATWPRPEFDIIELDVIGNGVVVGSEIKDGTILERMLSAALATKINGKAEQTDLTALTQRVTTNETDIATKANSSDVPTNIDDLSDVATKPTTGGNKQIRLDPATGNITWIDEVTGSTYTLPVNLATLNGLVTQANDGKIIEIDWDTNTNTGTFIITDKFSGSYNDLTDKPNIPAAVTSLPWASITGKPTLFSGSWNDLSNRPTTFNANIPVWSSGTNYTVGNLVRVSSGSNSRYFSCIVAISNSQESPELDTDNTNWLEIGKVTTSISWDNVTGKPTFFSGSYNDLTDKPDLFSGSYDDLTNKPTIPAAVTSLPWSSITGKPDLFSGSWNDLTDKPTIPSASYDVTSLLTEANDGKIFEIDYDTDTSTGSVIAIDKPSGGGISNVSLSTNEVDVVYDFTTGVTTRTTGTAYEEFSRGGAAYSNSTFTLPNTVFTSIRFTTSGQTVRFVDGAQEVLSSSTNSVDITYTEIQNANVNDSLGSITFNDNAGNNLATISITKGSDDAMTLLPTLNFNITSNTDNLDDYIGASLFINYTTVNTVQVNIDFTFLRDTKFNMDTMAGELYLIQFKRAGISIAERTISKSQIQALTATTAGTDVSTLTVTGSGKNAIGIDTKRQIDSTLNNTHIAYIALTSANNLLFGLSGWTNTLWPQPEIDLVEVDITTS